MSLRPYQNEAIAAACASLERVRSALVVMPTGCHAAGQGILTYGGDAVPVEQVEVGDALMGPDSRPRIVQQLARGVDDLYEIVPTKGTPWTVNVGHILTLVHTETDEVIDVSLRDWLGWSKYRKHCHKLLRAPVARFACAFDDFPVDPYFLGLLLGDGSIARGPAVTTTDEEIVEAIEGFAWSWSLDVRRCTSNGTRAPSYYLTDGRPGRRGNRLRNALIRLGLGSATSHSKFIPRNYRCASPRSRLALLAGLMDSDGHLTDGGFDYISASPDLAHGVAFVARSMGLAAYARPCQKRAQTGGGGTYYRVSISGDVGMIPCRKRAAPRQQVKDVLRTGFSVRPLSSGAFYGFSLDGDGRYLLDDFTITHNTGKTVVFAKIAEAFAPLGGVIVLAHREELIRQATDKIQHWTSLRCEVEMGEERARLDGLYPPDVVVASVQSISRARRLGRFPEFWPSMIIVDEAHHALAKTYRDVFDYFPHAKVLGVTATPDRGDKTAMGQVFEEAAFVYEIRQAIAEGYLVPILQKAVEVEGLDLSKVRTTAGDLNEGDLDKILRTDEHLHRIAQPIHELSGTRKTLIFGVTVAHAHDLARVLNGYAAGQAEALDGTATPELRAKVIDRFRRGETRFLVNCSLFTEGFDLPAISCVAIARPTKSRALYAQMIGRGTRPITDAAGVADLAQKPDLLVLDFEGNAGRHSLASAIDVLAGDSLSADERERAEEIVRDHPDKSVLDAIDQAKADIEERKRQEALRAQRGIQVGTKKRVTDIDPFACIGIDAPAKGRGSWGGPPSEKQIAALTKLGFPAESSVWEMDRTQASATIDALIARQKKGLPSYKMSRLLLKHGLSPDMPFAEAKDAVARIAANGWRLPHDLRRQSIVRAAVEGDEP